MRLGLEKAGYGWLVGAVAALAALIAAAPFAKAAELLMFERAGCAWCQRWNAEIGPIYPRTPEGRVAPLRRIDLEGGEPAGLSLAGRVRYTPTFILVDDGGREIGRITGYLGEDAFWGLASAMIGKLEKAGQ